MSRRSRERLTPRSAQKGEVEAEVEIVSQASGDPHTQGEARIPGASRVGSWLAERPGVLQRSASLDRAGTNLLADESNQGQLRPEPEFGSFEIVTI